ncbi:hypothetical protein [Allorhizocola rhizosphaerae]|uniref:hypothetical protein n=1 Tax=Allorhizocola rhizosphaerae TaxID=1872709 RepID=UPI000E3B97CE|nr:hypothetical protein [Allorhizocola rhizosphaerae]
MTPLVLRGVVKRLRKLEAQRPPVLRFESMRPEIHRLVERLAPSHSDREVIAAVDAFIAGRIQEFWADATRDHNLTTAQLNELATQVRAYVQEVERLNEDVRSRFVDMNGAVIHALDRVTNPDTPFFDPIPPHTTEGQR